MSHQIRVESGRTMRSDLTILTGKRFTKLLDEALARLQHAGLLVAAGELDVGRTEESIRENKHW